MHRDDVRKAIYRKKDNCHSIHFFLNPHEDKQQIWVNIPGVIPVVRIPDVDLALDTAFSFVQLFFLLLN